MVFLSVYQLKENILITVYFEKTWLERSYKVLIKEGAKLSHSTFIQSLNYNYILKMNGILKIKKTPLTTFVSSMIYFPNFSCKSWFPVSAFPVVKNNTWWLRSDVLVSLPKNLVSGLVSYHVHMISFQSVDQELLIQNKHMCRSIWLKMHNKYGYAIDHKLLWIIGW